MNLQWIFASSTPRPWINCMVASIQPAMNGLMVSWPPPSGIISTYLHLRRLTVDNLWWFDLLSQRSYPLGTKPIQTVFLHDGLVRMTSNGYLVGQNVFIFLTACVCVCFNISVNTRWNLYTRNHTEYCQPADSHVVAGSFPIHCGMVSWCYHNWK